MASNDVFKRYEIKYLLTVEQFDRVRSGMDEYMRGDKYGQSDICNLYCDTPDFVLARRSIERPVYKEKLRIRSYGVAKPDSEIFVEIKKKYESIVYKRRIVTDERGALALFDHAPPAPTTQIGREIDYFIKLYDGIAPVMFISYRREAFYGRHDKDFRMTFDRDILWRTDGLDLGGGIYGTRVLAENMVLMEVKTAEAIPLWLVKILSDEKVYKTSFSKYGSAYVQLMRAEKGGRKVA